MDCFDAAKLLFEFLDRELEDECCSELEEHLSVCDRCRYHFEFERLMIVHVKQCGSGGGAPKKLKEKLKKQIDDY